MPDGGFLIRFDGKETERCYACKFDYDERFYTVNDGKKKSLPDGVEKIEIFLEP